MTEGHERYNSFQLLPPLRNFSIKALLLLKIIILKDRNKPNNNDIILLWSFIVCQFIYTDYFKVSNHKSVFSTVKSFTFSKEAIRMFFIISGECAIVFIASTKSSTVFLQNTALWLSQ